MKKLHEESERLRALSRDEMKSITGGGLTSYVLGNTIFGFARLCGMLAGYASR